MVEKLKHGEKLNALKNDAGLSITSYLLAILW
jgi:hypothetical protein